MKDLDAIAKELLLTKSAIEHLQREAEELEAKIRKIMTRQKRETIIGDGWKASQKRVELSRFDVPAFRADHAKLYRAYKRPAVITRFSISAYTGETDTRSIPTEKGAGHALSAAELHRLSGMTSQKNRAASVVARRAGVPVESTRCRAAELEQDAPGDQARQTP